MGKLQIFLSLGATITPKQGLSEGEEESDDEEISNMVRNFSIPGMEEQVKNPDFTLVAKPLHSSPFGSPRPTGWNPSS